MESKQILADVPVQSLRAEVPLASLSVELHQAIHTPHPVVIPDQTATADQLEQLVEASLWKTLGQLGQQSDYRLVPIGSTSIARGRSRQSHQLTGPALASIVDFHQPRHERAFVRWV
jgi:hypothetical protein